MAGFSLNESIEYLQIKEKYQFINKSIYSSSGPDVLASVAAITPVFIGNISKPGMALIAAHSTPETHAKRAAICQTLFTPQFLESKASSFKAEVLRNYNILYSISNYSFAPLLFQLDCETEELKKFRSITQPNEDPRLKMSRILRRKAEESYRNGQWDEAIRQFNESDEKNESDYTTHYQLGLIYFFEKADYNEACNSFKKAAKLSQNKSSVVFICSTVFFGLLLRLFATVTRSQNLLEESYSALAQAYNLDNQNPMANYALAQSCASLAQKSNFAGSAKDLIKRLVKINEFTALQMIYDVAFDAFLPQIEEAVSSLITEMKNSS
ncbi:MAG TPA: hypothetical protein PK467_02640, partial [Candidatus Wallbacteria bacterium]|nr:hypothetical protein [Candidatus Wallbacteria bacterium]